MASKRSPNTLPLVTLASSALALLLMTSLLAGCGSNTVQVGWVGSSDLGHIGYRYTTFDGVERKTFRAVRIEGQATGGSFDISWSAGD